MMSSACRSLSVRKLIGEHAIVSWSCTNKATYTLGVSRLRWPLMLPANSPHQPGEAAMVCYRAAACRQTHTGFVHEHWPTGKLLLVLGMVCW